MECGWVGNSKIYAYGQTWILPPPPSPRRRCKIYAQLPEVQANGKNAIWYGNHWNVVVSTARNAEDERLRREFVPVVVVWHSTNAIWWTLHMTPLRHTLMVYCTRLVCDLTRSFITRTAPRVALVKKVRECSLQTQQWKNTERPCYSQLPHSIQRERQSSRPATSLWQDPDPRLTWTHYRLIASSAHTGIIRLVISQHEYTYIIKDIYFCLWVFLKWLNLKIGFNNIILFWFRFR